MKTLSLLLWLVLGLHSLSAADVYMKPSAFIEQTFKGKKPKAGAIALTAKLQADIRKLTGRRYKGSRIRHWTLGGRTVWILNEIGKTQPITTGYVIKGGKVEEVKVLIYRESHGYEVKERFFTKQFKGASLQTKSALSKRIDNVAGATLSVNALKKMAKLALFLDANK